ncbi:hypothetical protein SAMN05428970_1602 [Agromyces sp. CF514]|uniref:endonuclease domain-containing protein n=1 Tax=Agromyces sp. CF514 TaxID=1881031 RepID=UPI0008E5D340|nr:hypothetical protein [Agromyces sp. CF514]SFR73766.1 hypothetical protein SAMN05428970_1602 [Agromyces sp. CF514]
MIPASRLPSHLQGAAFLASDVHFHEATRSRLRGRDVQRPFTGVRAVGLDLEAVLDRCRAYEPLLRQGDAFSHETAAGLYGLPLPSPSRFVHVLAGVGSARSRTRGVTGHTTRTAVPIRVVHGLPVVPPAIVWCQLAASLRREDLVAVGDALVTGRREGRNRASALATFDDLRGAVRIWGSGRGARNLAWALFRVRVGAESRPESLTRLLLVEHHLPEPIANDPTSVRAGLVLHPDLKWERWRIVLEYEGDGHRTSRSQWQRDIRRQRDFEAAGWAVIRVTSHDLFVDPAAFIARVRDVIALRCRDS